MATHSSIFAWKIPWIEEPGGLKSMWLQRVEHDWAHTSRHTNEVCQQKNGQLLSYPVLHKHAWPENGFLVLPFIVLWTILGNTFVNAILKQLILSVCSAELSLQYVGDHFDLNSTTETTSTCVLVMLILASCESQMLIVVFAGKLVEQRKHSDAATVLEQYAQVNSTLSSSLLLTPPRRTHTKSLFPICTLAIMKRRDCGYSGNPEIVFPLKVFHLAYLTWKSKFSISLLLLSRFSRVRLCATP